MTRPPCGAFESGPVRHRCVHCGWSKANHRTTPKALCATSGKVRHRTRASAAKQLHKLVTRPVAGKDPQALMTYLCTHCRDWHVGHGAGDDPGTTRPRPEGA